MVKLDPSSEQHEVLCETMKRFNEACNHIAETVFALHSANKVEIHKTEIIDHKQIQLGQFIQVIQICGFDACLLQ